MNGARLRSRLLAVFAAALASTLAISEVYAAQFSQTSMHDSGTPPQPNGTSFGTGAMNNGEPNDGGFYYTPPSGPPPTSPPASVTFYVEICCNSGPTPRCVEYSGSYVVIDANQVSSSPQTIPSGDSCNPCQECIMLPPITAPVAGSSSVFVAAPGALPPSGVTVSITANCKTCNANPVITGTQGYGSDTMDDRIWWPPP